MFDIYTCSNLHVEWHAIGQKGQNVVIATTNMLIVRTLSPLVHLLNGLFMSGQYCTTSSSVYKVYMYVLVKFLSVGEISIFSGT